eukprot:2993893-Pleurochrysis_carterae.AAC.11
MPVEFKMFEPWGAETAAVRSIGCDCDECGRFGGNKRQRGVFGRTVPAVGAFAGGHVQSGPNHRKAGSVATRPQHAPGEDFTATFGLCSEPGEFMDARADMDSDQLVHSPRVDCQLRTSGGNVQLQVHPHL